MNRRLPALLLAAYLVGVYLLAIPGEGPGANYQEARVPDYTLPPVRAFASGLPIADPKRWVEVRRPELLGLFTHHVYGAAPEPAAAGAVHVDRRRATALQGLAERLDVRVTFTELDQRPTLRLLVYLPARRDGPSPTFLALNRWGNHTIHPDRGIPAQAQAAGAPAPTRGAVRGRWPVETILRRGYAFATCHAGAVAPEGSGSSAAGLHAAVDFPTHREDPGAWGVIAAWAWGLSRLRDVLATLPEVDGSRIAVVGHSRLGKAALWAGARDPSFALVIASGSGCGGAALSRRRFGETVAHITSKHPTWFCRRFAAYAHREGRLPVDQHQLLALIAPRPLYVASATQDGWADPRGEYLSVRAASGVYALFGKGGPEDETMPPPNVSVGEDLAYHIRDGEHDITRWDWERFLDFADRHLGRR